MQPGGADFDGTNDYLRTAAAMSVSDSKTGILSVWLRKDGGDNTGMRIFTNASSLGNTNCRFELTHNGSGFGPNNTFSIKGRNGGDADANNTLYMETTSTKAAGSGWFHLLASWDLAVGLSSLHLYIDGTSVLQTSNDIANNNNINYNEDDWAVGAACSASFKWNGCIAELYFAAGQYLDFSVAANRQKFRSSGGGAQDLGANGSRPTGTQPTVYMHRLPADSASTFATNLGSGGSYSITGSLDASSTNPPEGDGFIDADFLAGGNQVFQATANLNISSDFLASGSQVFQSLANAAPALDRALSRFKLDFKNDWDRAIALFNTFGTFSRSGTTATYFDSNGDLQATVANEPRHDHDPVTLLSKGWLLEGAAGNSIRNNTMGGASPGTPGTLPTNWVMGTTSNGISREIVGTGTENNINYIDIRYTGTVASGTLFYSTMFEAITQIPCTPGQIWNSSVYARVVGGSTANVTRILVGAMNRDAGGVILNQYITAAFLPSTDALRTQRFYGQGTASSFTDVNTAFVSPFVQLEAVQGAVIDITVRYGLPQLEAESVMSSVIKTTGVGSANRATEIPLITSMPWFLPSAGTMIAEAFHFGHAGGSHRWACFSNGTNDNRIEVGVSGSNNLNFFVTDATVNQASLNPAAGIIGRSHRFGGAWATNDFAAAANGSAVSTDAAGTVPAADRLALGRTGSGGETYMWLENFEYIPSRISNTLLQQKTQQNVVVSLNAAIDHKPSSFQGYDQNLILLPTLDFIPSTFVGFDPATALQVALDFLQNEAQFYDPFFSGIWEKHLADTDSWSKQEASSDAWVKQDVKISEWG